MTGSGREGFSPFPQPAQEVSLTEHQGQHPKMFLPYYATIPSPYKTPYKLEASDELRRGKLVFSSLLRFGGPGLQCGRGVAAGFGSQPKVRTKISM